MLTNDPIENILAKPKTTVILQLPYSLDLGSIEMSPKLKSTLRNESKKCTMTVAHLPLPNNF